MSRGTLTYVQGNAAHALNGVSNVAHILHVVNNLGVWGAGFVLSLDEVSSYPRSVYRSATAYFRRYPDKNEYLLGKVSTCKMYRGSYKTSTRPTVPTMKSVRVWHLFAQRGVAGPQNPHPLSYYHLSQCLEKVCNRLYNLSGDVHMPRIGCGLAGGKWEVVEQIIQDTLIYQGKTVYVYDLPKHYSASANKFMV